MEPKEKTEEVVVEKTQPTPEELIEKIKALESDKNNLVGEITDMRKIKRELEETRIALEEALKASVHKNSEDPEADKVESTVRKILSEESQKRAKSNKIQALEKFIAGNKEYHSENDPTGMKREALERKLSLFNTSELIEEKDFYTVIEDANKLLRGTDTAPKGEDEADNPYSETPKGGDAPRTVVVEKINSKEKELIERNGWTEEKFLQLKSKMPDFIQSLLSTNY